jgi:hypothetical protein
LAKVCPLVFIASKRPRVTLCFGCQLAFKKLITYGKISHPPFDINKSKLVTAKWHSIRVGKTYNCLVFMKRTFFQKEKLVLDTNAYQII